MSKVKVFQIYFDKEQIKELDSNFIPFDNTDNARPDLREYYVWNKLHNSNLVADVDYWGALSWQYSRKTGSSGKNIIDSVINKPGFDVYYICPFSFRGNVWVQGDQYHSGLSETADLILNKLNYNISCRTLNMPISFFCNYFVANKYFWSNYMNFIHSFLELCENDKKLYDRVHGLNYDYNGGKLSMFSFLIERFTSTFITLHNMTHLSCK